MNAISYALSMIGRKIPKDILDKTFLSNVHYMTSIPVSTDSRIREIVINGRV